MPAMAQRAVPHLVWRRCATAWAASAAALASASCSVKGRFASVIVLGSIIACISSL